MSGKKLIWLLWAVLSLGLASYYLYQFTGSADKSALLIGDTSHGHFQIEMACSSCHAEPFGGPEVLQNACVNCHGAELTEALDSHPKKKFTDPRNADRVAILDARYCVTCHAEHKAEATLAMGLTMPEDYCFHCHQDIGEDRPSHAELKFPTCATSGCHNYHDNRALYEDFLVANANTPDFSAHPMEPLLASLQNMHTRVRSQFDANTAPVEKQNATVIAQWHQSGHALAGVDCQDCHAGEPQLGEQEFGEQDFSEQQFGEQQFGEQQFGEQQFGEQQFGEQQFGEQQVGEQQVGRQEAWLEKPGLAQCKTCHAAEAAGFLAGKHGMRLAVSGVEAMTALQPQMVKDRLTFTEQSMQQEHGCNTCHGAHSYDRVEAAVASCLNCHADEHSVAYRDSPHGKHWQAQSALLDEPAHPVEPAVTCATCHMPRRAISLASDEGAAPIRVDHNQNYNLRPNEKMIRSVCMNCHGLEFALDALADPALIKNNFSGRPSQHVPSIDWALRRAKEPQPAEAR